MGSRPSAPAHAGVDIAVRADRSAFRSGAQVLEKMPGGELAEHQAVLGIGETVQPGGKPLLEQEQEPVDRENARC